MCDHIRQEYDPSSCDGCKREQALITQVEALKGRLARYEAVIHEAMDNQAQLPYEHCDYDLIKKWKGALS